MPTTVYRFPCSHYHLKDTCDFQVVEYRDEDVGSQRNHNAIPKYNHHVLRSVDVDLSRSAQKSDGRHEAGQKRQRHGQQLRNTDLWRKQTRQLISSWRHFLPSSLGSPWETPPSFSVDFWWIHTRSRSKRKWRAQPRMRRNPTQKTSFPIESCFPILYFFSFPASSV